MRRLRAVELSDGLKNEVYRASFSHSPTSLYAYNEAISWNPLRKTPGERFGKWPIIESVFVAGRNGAVGAKLVH